MGFKGKCQKNFSTDRELEIGSPESLRFNGGSFAKLRNLQLVRPVATANKDEDFYLNYKEASGTKRSSQNSAGG